MSEYFAIKRILRSGGGLKFAQVLLAHRESRRIEAEAKAQVDNMTMNSENQLKAEAAKSDTKLREITLESQLKKEEETHKTNEAIRLEERKSQLRIQQEKL